MARSPVVRAMVLLFVSLGLLGGAGEARLTPEATPAAGGVTLFPPDGLVYGAMHSEWSARHWQWTASFPVPINPGHDVTGSTCGYGQSGPVFFIPRNFPPCTVPAGLALYIPIAGTECSTVEPPPYFGRDEAALRSCAAAEVDRYTGIVVRVDGQDLPDIEAYRASSPLFTLALPENNVLGVPAGVSQAVADGYQMILAPLSAGEHEIMAHVELTDGTVLPDKVLQITVVSPTVVNPGATPEFSTPEATPVAS